VDDVIMGCANPEGATGANIARQAALRAGLPITVSGMTVNRFCSSGLQTIADGRAAHHRRRRRHLCGRRCGSISCVQQEMNQHMLPTWLWKHKPEIYWNMLQTAEQVAKRYGISREPWTSTAPPASKRPAPRWKPACSTTKSRPSPSPPVWPTRSWACAPRKSP
jgi:acetyl-CoA C-acetyltransferase